MPRLLALLALLLVPALAHAADAPAKPPTVMALVGCAHIHTDGYARTLAARPDAVKVKAVWDHQPARAKPRAELLGAAFVSDVAAIFADPEIKAVVICSETARHEELVIAAAKARKHIFVEKPLALGMKDGYAMVKAVEEAGVLFNMGYQMRSDGSYRFLREQVQKGALGKITRIRGSNCHGLGLDGAFDPKPAEPTQDWSWTPKPELAGVGAFGDIATHPLDLMIWMLGDVDRVTAQLDPGTARYPNCDETGEALLRFKNGAIGTLAGSWIDPQNPITLEIAGTEGHAIVMRGQVIFQSKKIEGADHYKPWNAQLPKKLPSALDLFVDAVRGEKDLPLVTIREAAYRSAVMEAMYQAAKEGKWVAAPPPPAK